MVFRAAKVASDTISGERSQMQTKRNVTIFTAVLAASLLVYGGLSAQESAPKPEGACKKCHTDFKACREKAKADFSGKEKQAERRKAIEACRATHKTCTAPCKDCKKSCQAMKKDGREQCKQDFDPKTICEKNDKECQKTVKSEREACIKNSNSTNCNDQCRVQ